jgi:hypothetical protein
VSDRHTLWRLVERNLRGMEENAPEGYVAVATVFLAGRERGVVVSRVETRRGDFAWIFITEAGEESSEGPHPDDRAIFVHEHNVLRVELGYERRVARLGFTLGELPTEV